MTFGRLLARPRSRHASLLVACGVAAALLPGSTAFAKSLIKDGSFEKPVVPDGSYSLFNTGDTFNGWTVVGASGNVGIISQDFQYCVALPAKKGKQWLDLTGTTQTVTGVQQSIKTTPGASYTITFFVGNIVGTGNCGTTSTVDLVIDGTPAGSFTNSKDGGTLVWKKFSAQFTAVNTTTTIAFMNGDPANDTANGLDGVSVIPNG